jgi:hypothetical protein
MQPNGNMTDTPQQTEEVEIIPPKEARARIRAAIAAKLGESWQDDTSGWLIVHNADYLVRLNKGSINLDFECDLLGEIIITEREANPLQTSGRLIALMVLAATLIVAFALAQLAGVFN